tara:strand:- start:2385 stop:2795 length:411 start_codon:yes stop_codon:yes gene_type:complete
MEVTIEVTVNAPIHIVWDAWTNEKHIVNWNFASDDWHCPGAKNPLQVGATFSWRMEAKDGSMGFDFQGVYDKIETNKLLEYHLEDNRKVKVEFEETDGQVRLLESFETEDQNSAELQKNGWQAILNHFKHYTESLI